MYAEIEQAREEAQLGRYPEARRHFDGVVTSIRRALKTMEDPQLQARWTECARAISDERDLVAAIEDECAALRLSDAGRVGAKGSAWCTAMQKSGGAAVGRWRVTLTAMDCRLLVAVQGAAAQQGALGGGGQRGGLAFDFDLQSSRLTPREVAPVRVVQSEGEEQHDPLKWRPPSPVPRCLSTPNSPANARGAPRHARRATCAATTQGAAAYCCRCSQTCQ